MNTEKPTEHDMQITAYRLTRSKKTRQDRTRQIRWHYLTLVIYELKRTLKGVDKSKMDTWLIPGNEKQSFLKCVTWTGNKNYIFLELKIFFHHHESLTLKIERNRESTWPLFWMKYFLFKNDDEMPPDTISWGYGVLTSGIVPIIHPQQ